MNPTPESVSNSSTDFKGLFIGSQSYNQIQTSLEQKFNHRLAQDYQAFLVKLSKIAPAEHLARLPPLEPVRISPLPKAIQSSKASVKIEKRCLALTNTGQRCNRQINFSTNSAVTVNTENNIFCLNHLKNPPTNSLDRLDDCFKAILSAPTKRTSSPTSSVQIPNTEYQMMNLLQQNGRKYYQVPVQNIIETEYIPVSAVQIDNQVYLKDATGRLFGISTTVPLLGRTDGHLIKWYQHETS